MSTPFLVPCHFPIPGYARQGGPILRRVPKPNGGAPLSKRVLDPEMGLNHWGFGKEGRSGVGRNPSQHYRRTRCRLGFILFSFTMVKLVWQQTSNCFCYVQTFSKSIIFLLVEITRYIFCQLIPHLGLKF